MAASSLDVVVAFIQTFQLEAVVNVLRQVPNFPGMSGCEVRGFGAHAAHPPRPGETSEVEPFKKKVRVEICCLGSAAHTGNPGDGKVFAQPLTIECRIRSGERGEAALLAGPPPPGGAQ